MLKLQKQDATDSAVLHVCNVLGGVCDTADSVRFTFALLLLKYLSDVGPEEYESNEPMADARFILPAQARFYSLHAARHLPDNAVRIDDALRALEAANAELRGVFQGISFDAPILGSREQKDRLLSRLLDAFNAQALDFRPNQEGTPQSAAAAGKALLMYVSVSSGKRGGEFFTTPELSQLIARLMHPRAGEAIFDPCCGTALTLIMCNQIARQASGGSGCTLYGQEVNGNTWALAKMNMILNGETDYELILGDTLRNPGLLDDLNRLKRFDVVVSNPPFSMRDWGFEDARGDCFGRYERGIPPRSSGDYAFISHMIQTLKPENGRMAVIVPLGVLSRGAAELQIRTELVKENLIDAVIALPAKMLFNTAIPAAILVIRQNKADDGILFIDASRSYQPGKIQNVLRQADLDQIEDTYHDRAVVEHYSRRVSQADIAANDFNLSVNRYIEIAANEVQVDLPALREARALLKEELVSLEAKLAKLLQEIGDASG